MTDKTAGWEEESQPEPIRADSTIVEHVDNPGNYGFAVNFRDTDQGREFYVDWVRFNLDFGMESDGEGWYPERDLIRCDFDEDYDINQQLRMAGWEETSPFQPGDVVYTKDNPQVFYQIIASAEGPAGGYLNGVDMHWIVQETRYGHRKVLKESDMIPVDKDFQLKLGGWEENPDVAKWQHGNCDAYAKALLDMYPHLRLGVVDGGNHFFAHDDQFAYDSIGRHTLPYNGINEDFGQVDYDQDPMDWDYAYYPYGANSGQEEYDQAVALVPVHHPYLSKTAGWEEEEKKPLKVGDIARVKGNPGYIVEIFEIRLPTNDPWDANIKARYVAHPGDFIGTVWDWRPQDLEPVETQPSLFDKTAGWEEELNTRDDGSPLIQQVLPILQVGDRVEIEPKFLVDLRTQWYGIPDPHPQGVITRITEDGKVDIKWDSPGLDGLASQSMLRKVASEEFLWDPAETTLTYSDVPPMEDIVGFYDDRLPIIYMPEDMTIIVGKPGVIHRQLEESLNDDTFGISFNGNLDLKHHTLMMQGGFPLEVEVQLANRLKEIDPLLMSWRDENNWKSREDDDWIERLAAWSEVPVHIFDENDDTGRVYNITIASGKFHDGDVLVVPSEGVVGIMVSAWPTAVTENTGKFHGLGDMGGALFETGANNWAQYEGGRYLESYNTAVQEAMKLGLKVAKTAGWEEEEQQDSNQMILGDSFTDLKRLGGPDSPWILADWAEDPSYRIEASVFDIPSVYGINGGRVSKFWIHHGREIVVAYDRGWEQKPYDDVTNQILDAFLEAVDIMGHYKNAHVAGWEEEPLSEVERNQLSLEQAMVENPNTGDKFVVGDKVIFADPPRGSVEAEISGIYHDHSYRHRYWVRIRFYDDGLLKTVSVWPQYLYRPESIVPRTAGWDDEAPPQEESFTPQPGVRTEFYILEDGTVLIEGINTEYSKSNRPAHYDTSAEGYIENGEPVITAWTYRDMWDAQASPRAKYDAVMAVKKTYGDMLKRAGWEIQEVVDDYGEQYHVGQRVFVSVRDNSVDGTILSFDDRGGEVRAIVEFDNGNVLPYELSKLFRDEGQMSLPFTGNELDRMKTASPISNYQWIPLTQYELQGWEDLSQQQQMGWRNRAIRHNDRARKFGAPGGVTARELWALNKRFENQCAYCGKYLAWGTPEATLDHVQAISLGGTGDISNIVPACRHCNQELAKWDQRNNPEMTKEDYYVPDEFAGGVKSRWMKALTYFGLAQQRL